MAGTPPLIAIDTETTGLELRHGRRPFMVTTWKEDEQCHNRIRPTTKPDSLSEYLGGSLNFTFPVNPLTREVNPDRSHLKRLVRYLQGCIPVFYNAPFDFTALATLGVYFEFDNPQFSTALLRTHCSIPNLFPQPSPSLTVHCSHFHDVQLLAHVTDNKGPKDLKSLSLHYLELSDSDEKFLKQTVNEARRYARRDYPDWSLGINPKGDKEPGADYWLPHTLHEHNPDYPDYFATAVAEYGSLDAYRTLGCLFVLRGILDYADDDYASYAQYKRQMAFFPALLAMEAHGLNLLPKKLKPLSDQLLSKSQHLKSLNDRTIALALNRPNASCTSPIDLTDYLYEHLNLPIHHYTEKALHPATDAPSLIHCLRHIRDSGVSSRETRVARAFIDRQVSYNSKDHGTPNDNIGYKSYATGSGYLTNYLARAIPTNWSPHYPLPSERFHDDPHYRYHRDCPLTLFPTYNQTGTAWTRLSSQNPNGQNISKKPEMPLRSVFGPPPGKLWLAIDYSQLEIRLFARAAQAEDMLSALRRGEDIHLFTACHVYQEPPENITSIMRRNAKTVNFGIIYGMGESKMTTTVGDPEFLRIYKQRFPSVDDFMRSTISDVDRDGYVYTLFGYRLNVYPDPSYKGPNGIIQGTAGDIVKEAMVDLYHQGIHPIANFHDELLFEIRDESMAATEKHANVIMATMEAQGDKIQCPTPVDCKVITDNWAEGISLDLFLNPD